MKRGNKIRSCGDAEMRRRGERGFFFKSVILCAVALFGFACQPNAAILESAKNASAEQSNRVAASGNSTVNSFERDLETMRTANFDYIYVFRRKDGAPLESDDKKYLKMNSPVETNRFILSDADKAAIAGSKYKFAEQNLMALRDRFLIEDFSKPPSNAPPNASNANS